MSDQMHAETTDDTEERIDSLEALVEDLQNEIEDLRDERDQYREMLKDERDSYREHQVEAPIADLQATCDDARDERVELRETLTSLQNRVTDLESRQEQLVGVDNSDDSTPAQRAIDLRDALITRATVRQDRGAGHAQAHHQEVADILAEKGHGTVSKPDCYRAMKEAALGIDTQTLTEGGSPPGFTLVDDAGELDGRSVRVVRCELDALPDGWVDAAEPRLSSDATTGGIENNHAAAATDGGVKQEQDQ